MTMQRNRILTASALVVCAGAFLAGCTANASDSAGDMKTRATELGYACTETVPSTGQPVQVYFTCVSGDLDLQIVAFDTEEDLKANQSGYSPPEMSWESAGSILVAGSDEEDVATVMGEAR